MGVKLLKCGAIQIEVRPRDLAAQWLTRLLAFKLSQPERIGNWQQGLGEELEYKESRAKVPHSFFFFLLYFHPFVEKGFFLLSNTKPLSCLWMNKQSRFLFSFSRKHNVWQSINKSACQRVPVGRSHRAVFAMGKGLPIQRPEASGGSEQRRDLPLKTRQTEQLALVWQAEGNCRNYSSRRSCLPRPT